MIQKLITEIEKQGNNHPDLSLRGFYKALLELIETHPKTKNYLVEALSKRTDVETTHLVNLAYRAMQFVLIYEHEKKDMGEYTYEIWKEVITNLMDNEKTYTIIIEKTLKENTQTNIYQRYAGPKAILSKLYGTKKIDVIDVGCSQNIGLMGLELHYPFMQIKDHTKSKELTKLLNNDLNIKNATGIDIEDPSKKLGWALACRFYPKELKQFDMEEQMIRFFKNQSKNTKFIKESVLKLSKLWEKQKFQKVDAVVTSLILYQLPEGLKEKAIEEIGKILKDGGVLIINDFVKVNSHIKWNVPWFENGQSNYKTIVLKKTKDTFSEPLEYILWDSGRCQEAYPGKDFNNI